MQSFSANLVLKALEMEEAATQGAERGNHAPEL